MSEHVPAWRYRKASAGGYLVFRGGEIPPLEMKDSPYTEGGGPLFHVYDIELLPGDACDYLNALETTISELREENARLTTWANDANQAAIRDAAELTAIKAERDALRIALVEAAIPLEALHMSAKWELAPEMKAEIANVVTLIRAQLTNQQKGDGNG